MKSPPTWILVADAGRARLFTLRPGRNRLVAERDWVDPAGRLPDREQTSSLGGRKSGSGGPVGTLAPATSPADHAAERFAHDLADTLEEGRVSHAYKDLVLVAPPQFLGLLKGELGTEVSRTVRHAIGKDYTQLPPDKLWAQLSPVL